MGAVAELLMSFANSNTPEAASCELERSRAKPSGGKSGGAIKLISTFFILPKQSCYFCRRATVKVFSR